MTMVQVHTASNGAQFPFYAPEVYRTPVAGTPYLREAGFAVLSQPQFAIEPLGAFLSGFDKDLGFADYMEDDWSAATIDPAAAICKVAGQLCYMSFDEKRTKNADAKRYFDNIKSSRHGSVAEHASVTFLLWGDSRSLTHELVRHRVGIGYSQVSQRYVDGAKLRFIERPEYVGNRDLHASFEEWIDICARQYDYRAKKLSEQMMSDSEFVAMPRVERCKRVNQAARACLPNETEAPIMVTSNIRTFRHLIENRASRHAEIEIRRAFDRLYEGLNIVAHALVDDYKEEKLSDGTTELTTIWSKI